MKLTDTQRVLLSAASQRQDGAVDVGSKFKGGAVDKVIGRLAEPAPNRGNIGALPVWRRDEDKGALALRITGFPRHPVAIAGAVNRATPMTSSAARTDFYTANFVNCCPVCCPEALSDRTSGANIRTSL